MPALTFKVLRLLFSILTSALLAWIIAAIFDLGKLPVFLALVLGFPVISWLNRVKNIPAHLAAAYILNKQLVAEAKRNLRRLPITTADEWNEFQVFYESDDEITKYRSIEPKAYAVAVRYEINTLKECGFLVAAIQSSWVITQAIEQLWDEAPSQQGGL